MTELMELAAWSDAGGSGTGAGVVYQKAFPGLKTFRVFSPTLPASIENTDAKGAHAAGFRLIASCKPPKVPTSSANATLDKWLQSLFDNDLATNWHEPENDMDGPTFKKMIGNLIDRRNAVKPKLAVGYIAMAYQYEPVAGRTVKNPDDWYDERLDWLGCDVYFPSWQFGAKSTLAQLHPLQNTGFKRWYEWAKTKNKPLYINELGYNTALPDDLRAKAYDQAFQFFADNGFKLVSPWNDSASNVFAYWGAKTAYPLTERVVRTWTAKNLTSAPGPAPAPAPAPAKDDTPWAAPITPDPTDRIKADQTDLGVPADGRLGNVTLTGFEAAMAERDVLRKRVADVEAVLEQTVKSLQDAEAVLKGTTA